MGDDRLPTAIPGEIMPLLPLELPHRWRGIQPARWRSQLWPEARIWRSYRLPRTIGYEKILPLSGGSRHGYRRKTQNINSSRRLFPSYTSAQIVLCVLITGDVTRRLASRSYYGEGMTYPCVERRHPCVTIVFNIYIASGCTQPRQFFCCLRHPCAGAAAF